MSAMPQELVPDRRVLNDRNVARMAERSRQAMQMLQDTVVIDPEIRHGVPVLKGTRFTIPQLLAEIAEGRSVEQLARAFSLDLDQLRNFLHGLAIYLDSQS